jgi:hypothetical protein
MHPSVTFENVPPRGETNGPYSLRVVAVNTDGVRTVIRTSVRPGELTGYSLRCTTILVKL